MSNRAMKIHLFMIMLLAVCSCKSPEEKLAGKWKIESYTYHGADSMAQLNRLHQNDIISLTESMPDPMGSWGITTTHLDTTYTISGRWYFPEKKELSFMSWAGSVMYRDKVIDSWNPYSSSPKEPAFVFLYGAWKIEKQGRNSLHLESKKDTEIKLKLKRH